MRSRLLSLLLGTTLCAVPVSLWAKANILILNGDSAGVGFNDTTPVGPVGGNGGTTLGAQRLIAFQAAADKWGATLTSNVPIQVFAYWSALSCTSNSAVLGSAGPYAVQTNFPSAPLQNTWYNGAEANALAGTNLAPQYPDIVARFNLNLGKPGCLDGVSFYLGLDNNHGSQVDLVTVLTHEFAHGLGFLTLTSGSTGQYFESMPSVWDYFVADDRLNRPWVDMTAQERIASAVSTKHLVWTGAQVALDAPSVLHAGQPALEITAPSAIAGAYSVGTGSLGAPLTSTGVSGAIGLVVDTAPNLGLACTPLSALNAAAVKGKIALVDRGVCSFAQKVAAAQAAGAVGVIVANNSPGAAPGISGTDPSITIPVVSVSQGDGQTLKAALSTRSRRTSSVAGIILSDPTLLAGANSKGQALLYAPSSYAAGSSVSHFDTSAFPNQLMEPAINGDLTHEVTVPFDLTYSLLKDIGWQ